MSRHHLSRMLLMFLAVLVALTVACSPCGWLSRRTIALSDRPLTIEEDAAQRFEDRLRGSWESQSEGQFRMQFTDDELTSYLNLRLTEAVSSLIAEPRVWLTRGKIYVAGELASKDLPISGQARLVASAQVSDGQVLLSIERGTLGPIPVPVPLLQSLEDAANSGLARAQMGISVTRLEILEGEAIIVATKD